MTIFGQLIIGAPGSGKTTYCDGMLQIFRGIQRPCVCVNLDPANDNLPFNPDINICELVTVGDVMDKLNLGPNGALLYCIQTLANNLSWLQKRLKECEGSYVLIDMPGQLELYSCDDSLRRILDQFRKWDWRFCAVHMTDSLYVSDAGKFISVVLSALSVMINLEVPQINVLSKIDLMSKDASFDFEYFEDLPDLKYLVDTLDDNPLLSKYKKLNQDLCDLIEDYNLVSFVGLDVQSKNRMAKILKMADTANGFSFVDEDFRKVVMRTTDIG